MKPQLRLILIISILASLIAFLDSTVVNVALPSIVHQLGGGLTAQQWIIDGYLLTLGSLILLAGSLSDLFGRKRILTIGLIGFMITSVACGLAPNTGFLITARIFQGFAGALLVPSSLALIVSNFSGTEKAKAIGAWTAWTGIAYIIGPLLGGFLVTTASWRWVFLINIFPILLTLYLLGHLHLNEKSEPGARIDILGAFLCALALGGIVYSFIEQPRYSWSSPLVWISMAVGLLSSSTFIWYEKKMAKKPMLQTSLFRIRNFSVGNAATLAIYGALAIATFILAIFLQSTAHFSALQAGLALIPVTIIMFAFSTLFGSLAGKYGPRFFMSVGPIAAGAGNLLFLRVTTHISYSTQLLPGIVVFGLGLSMTVAPLTAAVLGSIEPQHAGVASAINNAVARVAGLLAVALIGLVIGAAPFTSGVGHGVNELHKNAIFMACLLFIGGIISALGIQNQKSKVAIESKS